MSMPSSHTGRVAVVTGATGGFGTAISCELARRGADIIAGDLKPAGDTVSAVREIGQKAVALQADLANPAQVDAITADMLGFAGRADILCRAKRPFPEPTPRSADEET